MDSFNEWELSQSILDNLAAKGYERPTRIQTRAIPTILEKKDVVMQSHTGSGKTAAFGVPLIQNVMTDVPAVQFLILVPTRELASQVYSELSSMAKGMDIKLCAVYGGASMGRQVELLRGGAQVVVGTPGRILDHLKRRTMSVSVVRGLVLDEADKMLSMGFFQDVQLIFKYLPKRRQTVMSSATFPYNVECLIHQYMIEPERISLSEDEMAPKEIEHLFLSVANNEKEQALLALIEKEEPELSLIFCNTKVDVKSVYHFLTNAGISAEAMSSELSQSAREAALKRMRSGVSQHMVCTDVAARGIDIPALSHVFNFSVATDPETYVHRTGRTGRAGKSGRAISLVASLDLASFRQALKLNHIEAEEINLPTEEEINTSRVKRHYEHFKSMDFFKDADVRDEYSQLAEELSQEQQHSMFPVLLERFFRPETSVVVEPPPKVDLFEDNDSEDRGSGRRGDRRRGRNDRKGRRGRSDERGSRADRGSRGDRGEKGDRSDRGDRGDRPDRNERAERSNRSRGRGGDRDNRDQGRSRSDSRRAGGGRDKSYVKVCLGLGRQEGLDEMDVQNLLRRQGRARMDDIGEIVMKDHESIIDIGSGSLRSVLQADGKHYKSYEIFIGELSPPATEG